MSTDFKAIIRKTSPRYQEWVSVMGTDEIFLKSPVVEFASAPGMEIGRFLMMDLEELTSEQRERLVKHYCRLSSARRRCDRCCFQSTEMV